MYQAIVFLPLIGAIVAGLISLAGARARHPGGSASAKDQKDHHAHEQPQQYGAAHADAHAAAEPAAPGSRSAELVTTVLLFIAMILSWIAFVSVGFGQDARVQVASWIAVGDLRVDWALRVDTLTAVMLVVVTTISAFVHLYSIGYMEEDPYRPRFFSYLSLFTFAMLMLVTADNLVQLFFGWEGVGLASYLLIGFWYHKPEANAAAIKAFIVNRIGDFGFALGIFAVFMMVGALDFGTIFAQAPGLVGKTIYFLGYQMDALALICVLLFIGAMGKSAQFLLHTWLPDATVGLVQNDIKRIIAYSTCSQLGYMFVAMGVGAYSVGMFHLFTHASFKALLFLGSGSVITAMHHEQDIRKMGGLRSKLPFTYWTMIIGTLALTGFPLTAGYYSKDAVIEAAYSGRGSVATYGYLLTLISAALTAFYSWRLIFKTFHGEPNEHHAFEHARESPLVMLVPLAVLALGSIVTGFAFDAVFTGHGAEGFFRESLKFAHGAAAEVGAPWFIAVLPTVMMAAGFLVAWQFYIRRPDLPAELARQQSLLYQFLLNKWYFDEIYDFLLVRPALWLGRLLWKGGDERVIDGLGPDGISARVIDITRSVMRLQTGYLYHYAFAMLIGVAGLVTWFMFRGGLHP